MIKDTREVEREEEKLRQAGVGIVQSVTMDDRARGTATFNVGPALCSLEQLTEK